MYGVTLIALAFLTGCASNDSHSFTPKKQYSTLSELISDVNTSKPVDLEKEITIEALVIAGEDLGMSHGYIASMDQLLSYIESRSSLFDRLLPFESIIDLSSDLNSTEGAYIQPGMVDRIENASRLADKHNRIVIRRDAENYYLREQPKPVLRFPNWRDYLLDEETLIPEITITMIPRNDTERRILTDAIVRGWHLGKEQAEEEVKFRIRRAYRDLTGMVRYANVFDTGHLDKPTIHVESFAQMLSGDEMSLGVDFISLEGRAEWVTDTAEFDAPFLDGRASVRKEIQRRINTGDLTLDDINSEVQHHGQ